MTSHSLSAIHPTPSTTNHLNPSSVTEKATLTTYKSTFLSTTSPVSTALFNTTLDGNLTSPSSLTSNDTSYQSSSYIPISVFIAILVVIVLLLICTCTYVA